jgi:hypothetical protein
MIIIAFAQYVKGYAEVFRNDAEDKAGFDLVSSAILDNFYFYLFNKYLYEFILMMIDS